MKIMWKYSLACKLRCWKFETLFKLEYLRHAKSSGGALLAKGNCSIYNKFLFVKLWFIHKLTTSADMKPFAIPSIRRAISFSTNLFIANGICKFSKNSEYFLLHDVTVKRCNNCLLLVLFWERKQTGVVTQNLMQYEYNRQSSNYVVKIYNTK